MRGYTRKSKGMIAEARLLYEIGFSLTEIARRMGLRDQTSIRTWLEPAYAERRREIARAWRRLQGARRAERLIEEQEKRLRQ